jgi:PBP1b-binding outer membrane lipoprotein LpoB
VQFSKYLLVLIVLSLLCAGCTSKSDPSVDAAPAPAANAVGATPPPGMRSNGIGPAPGPIGGNAPASSGGPVK